MSVSKGGLGNQSLNTSALNKTALLYESEVVSLQKVLDQYTKQLEQEKRF